jgi:hypothetical protein
MTSRCGAGALAREGAVIDRTRAELRSAAQTATSGPTRFVVHAFAVFRSMLMEIFDESAYTRFLARTGMTSSPRAYAAFLDEQQTLKARRPRCC